MSKYISGKSKNLQRYSRFAKRRGLVSLARHRKSETGTEWSVRGMGKKIGEVCEEFLMKKAI